MTHLALHNFLSNQMLSNVPPHFTCNQLPSRFSAVMLSVSKIWYSLQTKTITSLPHNGHTLRAVERSSVNDRWWECSSMSDRDGGWWKCAAEWILMVGVWAEANDEENSLIKTWCDGQRPTGSPERPRVNSVPSGVGSKVITARERESEREIGWETGKGRKMHANREGEIEKGI